MIRFIELGALTMAKRLKMRTPTSPARRHFLVAASAAAVRVAALGVLATLPLRSSASANARLIGVIKRNRGGGPQCFLKGTHISGSHGETPVEKLKIGDLVQTVRGDFKPITWIGYRAYTRHRNRWQDSVRPVRVARGALSSNVPHRDLYLSPGHCLLIDGLLIPVGELVNGISITQGDTRPMDVIEYFHIALETHEVISAEGVDAETLFIQDGDHAPESFSNFAEYERLYPRDHRIAMESFAPRVWYTGGRSHLAAAMRLGVSKFVDVRDPIQTAQARLAERAARCVLEIG
jgi:hypothetical protein